MTPATKARLALAATTLPLLLAAVAVRPADAATPAYDSYSLTAVAGGVRTAGDVGAAGGLASIDTGSAVVTARLDSAPSAAVLAAPYEPGTVFRTVAGQVNGGAGEQVLDVPDAEAQFPGTQTEAELQTVPPASGGPVSSRGGAATARAGELLATGSATGEALVVAGALDTGASTSAVELTADPDSGVTRAAGRTTVGRVAVGVLELRDVVATAQIDAEGDAHVPTASLTVGSASVAGQAVVIGDEGVTAVGTPVVPGQTLRDATMQANAALAAAGIQVRTVGTVEEATPRTATADSGGVAISLVSPALPGGVPGNRLEVVVGGVVLTAADTPLLPELPSLPPVEVPPLETGAGSSSSTTTTFVPGTPGIPGTPGTAGEQPAAVAAPPARPAGLVVAGRSVSPALALAAFATWQFLSLGTATLYAVVDRRRRMAEAAA